MRRVGSAFAPRARKRGSLAAECERPAGCVRCTRPGREKTAGECENSAPAREKLPRSGCSHVLVRCRRIRSCSRSTTCWRYPCPGWPGGSDEVAYGRPAAPLCLDEMHTCNVYVRRGRGPEMWMALYLRERSTNQGHTVISRRCRPRACRPAGVASTWSH